MVTAIVLSSLMILFLYAAITSQAGLKRIQLHKIWEGKIFRDIKPAKKVTVIAGCMSCGMDTIVDQKDPFTICPECLEYLNIPASHGVKTYIN